MRHHGGETTVKTVAQSSSKSKKSRKQTAAAATEEEDGILVTLKKLKKKRANWVNVGNILILINALHDWDNNTDKDIDRNNEYVLLGHFCIIVGISLLTFETVLVPIGGIS